MRYFSIITWAAGARKPRTRHLEQVAGTSDGALGGMFWGMMLGILFFYPFIGMALGTAYGALAGHFATYGISGAFIDEVRREVTPVTPDTSALFLLTHDAVMGQVVDAMKTLPGFEIVSTTLPKEREDALRAAFAE